MKFFEFEIKYQATKISGFSRLSFTSLIYLTRGTSIGPGKLYENLRRRYWELVENDIPYTVGTTASIVSMAI